MTKLTLLEFLTFDAACAELTPKTGRFVAGGVPEQSSHASDRMSSQHQGWFPTASQYEAEKCQSTRTPAGLPNTDTGITASEEYQALMAGALT